MKIHQGIAVLASDRVRSPDLGDRPGWPRLLQRQGNADQIFGVPGEGNVVAIRRLHLDEEPRAALVPASRPRRAR